MFGIDSKFYEVVSRIADLVVVNLLFVLCSLPIITIGASTTALYGVTKRWQKTEKDIFSETISDCLKRILNSQQLCGLYYYCWH